MDISAVSALVDDSMLVAIEIGLLVTVLVFAVKATKWIRPAR